VLCPREALNGWGSGEKSGERGASIMHCAAFESRVSLTLK